MGVDHSMARAELVLLDLTSSTIHQAISTTHYAVSQTSAEAFNVHPLFDGFDTSLSDERMAINGCYRGLIRYRKDTRAHVQTA